MASTTDISGIQSFNYSDAQVSTFLDKIRSINVDSSYYLTILAGMNRRGKKDFLDKVGKMAGNELNSVDLNEIISQHEENSIKNIDRLFEKMNNAGKYILLENGDAFTGVYTSHSYSYRRYATPQERYFLRKMKDSEKVFFIDIQERDTISKSMERNAQTIISFDAPQSFVGKLLWKLGQLRVHGHKFVTERTFLYRD